MGKRKSNDIGPIREEWPRIRVATVRGVDYFQVDGRPHFKRKAFLTLEEARKQADKWENTRVRHGTAGKYISERDATKFAEALDILAPHGASITDAARHYAKYLAAEKLRASGKPVSDALVEWAASYAGKDVDIRTRQEIQSQARIYGNAFGHLKLGELKTDLLVEWIERYETQPGKLAMPRTRAKLKTKLSQFLLFTKRKEWIEENPLADTKFKRPPAAAVEIFDLSQVKRILDVADTGGRNSETGSFGQAQTNPHGKGGE